MKKILYISDYTFDVYNSVNDILYNIVAAPAIDKFENIIVRLDGRRRFPYDIKNYYNKYKTYTAPEQNFHHLLRNNEYSFFERVRCLYRRILFSVANRRDKVAEFEKSDNIKYIDSIIKREKPDLVVFYIYVPNTDYIDICIKRKVPYISILYDTYIERPGLDIKTGMAREKYVIENSKAHIVPSFFYDGYVKYYNNAKVKKFDLPLLIDKISVQQAYQKADVKYDFTYFGQIQSFRNGDKIKDLFRTLGLKLDVFSSMHYESDDVYTVHRALTQNDLYKVVAGSKFLVALDNSAPYNDYLPSKAYLYSSFTKPVIAFGDNKDSALKRFFKDYPSFYYQDINEPMDGLIQFINRAKEDQFDENIYNNYLAYLPENALVPLIEIIENIMTEKG